MKPIIIVLLFLFFTMGFSYRMNTYYYPKRGYTGMYWPSSGHHYWTVPIAHVQPCQYVCSLVRVCKPCRRAKPAKPGKVPDVAKVPTSLPVTPLPVTAEAHGNGQGSGDNPGRGDSD